MIVLIKVDDLHISTTFDQLAVDFNETVRGYPPGFSAPTANANSISLACAPVVVDLLASMNRCHRFCTIDCRSYPSDNNATAIRELDNERLPTSKYGRSVSSHGGPGAKASINLHSISARGVKVDVLDGMVSVNC